MYSFKNIYSPNINGDSLAFVMGPSKSGKSWFLKYNMRKFETSAVKPLVFHFDLQDAKMKNFEMFLTSFENMIIEELVKRNKDQKVCTIK